MNRQSHMDDAGQRGASSEDRDSRDRGELRKNSLNTGVIDLGGSAPEPSLEKGKGSSLPSPGELHPIDDADGDDGKTGESTISKKRSRIRLKDVEDEYPEFVEKTRAMSRIYSQRNRDKQKRQIEDLQELVARMQDDQHGLLETRKDFKQRLADIENENEVLRKQIIEQRQRDVMLLEQRNLAQRRQLQQDLLLSETVGRSTMMGHQGFPGAARGSGMLGGYNGMGMSSRAGGYHHQGMLPPIVPAAGPPGRWNTPQQLAGANPYPSVARNMPEYYPPNLQRPSLASMIGPSTAATIASTSFMVDPTHPGQLPIFQTDSTTMAALRLHSPRRESVSMSVSSRYDEKEGPDRPTKRSKKKKRQKK